MVDAIQLHYGNCTVRLDIPVGLKSNFVAVIFCPHRLMLSLLLYEVSAVGGCWMMQLKFRVTEEDSQAGTKTSSAAI